MAKYRGRKIAGVSTANPRHIMKKVARARAYASLHCSDGLKDESMKAPRSFADCTISTDFPSANVRGAIGGCPMGRSGLRGRSHFTDQSQAVRRLSAMFSYCDRGEIIFTSSANSRIFHSSRSGRSFTKKQEQKRPKDRSLRDAAGGGEGQGQAIVDTDSERTLGEEGLNPFDDFNMNAVGS